MRVKVTGVKKLGASKITGGKTYMVFFKDLDGSGSYRTYLDDSNRNFSYWGAVVNNTDYDKDLILNNVLVKDTNKKLIDADSRFDLVS